MFEDFDFTALDDPDFNEDAVREELVAPLLKRLGFRPTGEVKVQRGKSLSHPFVRVGTTDRPARLVPDYVLWRGESAVLVLDAKRPTENVRSGRHVEQAYSYAIHPDIRAPFFALCNGREFVMFDTMKAHPTLVFKMKEVYGNWTAVENHLGPELLAKPERRDYLPDLGTHLTRLGMTPGDVFTFFDYRPEVVSMISLEQFSLGGALRVDGVDYMSSVDLGDEFLPQVLGCLPLGPRERILWALRHQPFLAALEHRVSLALELRLGRPTQGRDDIFVPLHAVVVQEATLRSDAGGYPKTDGVPDHVVRLGRVLAEET
jgi:hypothetical protein